MTGLVHLLTTHIYSINQMTYLSIHQSSNKLTII